MSATVYDHFRVALGDFDSEIEDSTIDLCLYNGDKLLYNMVSEDVTDVYFRGLAAAYIYLNGKIKKRNLDNEGITKIVVGDTSETYGYTEYEESKKTLYFQLVNELRQNYAYTMQVINADTGLEYGVILNDQD